MAGSDTIEAGNAAEFHNEKGKICSFPVLILLGHPVALVCDAECMFLNPQVRITRDP